MGKEDGVGWTVCGRAKRGERGETARPLLQSQLTLVELGKLAEPTLGDLTNGTREHHLSCFLQY